MLLEGNLGDINATNSRSGGTALHVAANNNFLSVVEGLLCEKKVAINATTPEGNTALILATWKGHTRIVAALLSASGGGKANHNHSRRSSTILSSSLSSSSLFHQIDVDATNGANQSALIVAAHYNRQGIVAILLDRGADVKTVDADGLTAYDYCCTFDGFPPALLARLRPCTPKVATALSTATIESVGPGTRTTASIPRSGSSSPRRVLPQTKHSHASKLSFESKGGVRVAGKAAAATAASSVGLSALPGDNNDGNNDNDIEQFVFSEASAHNGGGGIMISGGVAGGTTDAALASAVAVFNSSTAADAGHVATGTSSRRICAPTDSDVEQTFNCSEPKKTDPDVHDPGLEQRKDMVLTKFPVRRRNNDNSRSLPVAACSGLSDRSGGVASDDEGTAGTFVETVETVGTVISIHKSEQRSIGMELRADDSGRTVIIRVVDGSPAHQ